MPGSFPPPALRKGGHRALVRRRVAVRWRPIFMMPKGQRPHPDMPTGTAAAFMMRPTTTPSASTSKSSSFHSPEGRLAEARLRTNVTFVPWPPATRKA